MLAADVLLAFLPLFVVVNMWWPQLYLKYRQPVVACLKLWAAFLATLLPDHWVASLGGGVGAATAPGEVLARAGLGLSAQLALHAIGEPGVLPVGCSFRSLAAAAWLWRLPWPRAVQRR